MVITPRILLVMILQVSVLVYGRPIPFQRRMEPSSPMDATIAGRQSFLLPGNHDMLKFARQKCPEIRLSKRCLLTKERQPRGHFFVVSLRSTRTTYLQTNVAQNAKLIFSRIVCSRKDSWQLARHCVRTVALLGPHRRTRNRVLLPLVPG
ncbi:hypothetical protein C8R42DRAFT_249982 [Lentinula raphanica]|nr:hypothetical protein C8R42DRAFT_249982 [Lentinula raphanica]